MPPGSSEFLGGQSVLLLGGAAGALALVTAALILTRPSRRSRVARPTAAAVGIPSRFRVEKELGRGGFARALLAHDTSLDRRVVLKQPLMAWAAADERARKRFIQEARLAARVHHPNVVTIHEILSDLDPPVLVMEFEAGGSIEEMLKRKRSLPTPVAVRIELDILSGLAAVHASGIVHRDLKPANILLDDAGRAKVADFGIAKPPPDLSRSVTMATDEYGQAGTVAYMSPEQLAGKAVDGRSDLYAAGAILYVMLTGRHYASIEGKTFEEAKQLLLATTPRIDSPLVPPALMPVLERALAKDVSLRFQNAGEMSEAIKIALKGPREI